MLPGKDHLANNEKLRKELEKRDMCRQQPPGELRSCASQYFRAIDVFLWTNRQVLGRAEGRIKAGRAL